MIILTLVQEEDWASKMHLPLILLLSARTSLMISIKDKFWRNF